MPLKLKGTSIIKAKRLKHLGMRFVAENQESGHIAARCTGCNMGLAKEPPCQAENGDCGLFADAGVSLAKTLSEEFMIDVAIEKPVV